ncbi:MAG: capsule assembly Wzi family protein [Candidatus Eiseniibacteriota bacterium]
MFDGNASPAGFGPAQGPRSASARGPIGLLAALTSLALAVSTAHAAPGQFLEVRDPLWREIRTLELFPGADFGDRIALAHTSSLPLTLGELEGAANPPSNPSPAAAISLIRLERALGRDARVGWSPDPAHPSTPRLFATGAPDQRLEFSAGLEGAAEADRDTAIASSGTGVHLRAAVALDRWLLYSHLVVGHFDQARSFADPVVANTDVTTLSEESYIAYGSEDGAWGAQFGRDRWHWGPGDEGSLILSRSSAPITALAYRGRLAGIRLDGVVINATLDAAAGEQLAAHRLEWQPRSDLRLGLSEAARYHASGWSPLYLAGVIPYTLVQRLQVQDEPDSTNALRNNVLFGLDAAWRVAPGTRLYGEIAIDDLHAKTSDNPDKIAWQLGWDGAGMIGRQRLGWGAELTRIWRFVYTSSYGRTYEAQGMPLGFPTGPDSRRVRVHLDWDPNADWQWSVRAASTDHGEGTLEDAFVPGSPHVDAAKFLGVVEHTREGEIGARWWPASGVDLSATLGCRWTENLAHVAGSDRSSAYGHVEFRLTR